MLCIKPGFYKTNFLPGLLKKTQFPLYLFFFFENLTLFYWTSSVVKPQHYVTFWPAQASHLLSKILHLEANLSESTLIEASVSDTTCYTPVYTDLAKFFQSYKYLAFYLFYSYQLKIKLTFCFPCTKQLASFESCFPNANWLEREFSELYGVNLWGKKDQRNLLLDYTNLTNPMQKGFPCVGEEEIFYNPLEEELIYYPNTSVEL